MKGIVLYFKRNLYFMISIIAFFLTLIFAIIVLVVLDLGKDVEGTSVGFIYLGSSEPSEYSSVLSPRISQWQKSADYAIRYQEYEWEINLDLFEFDVISTVNAVKSDLNNPAYFILSETNEEELFQNVTEHMTLEMINGFNFDDFLFDLTQDMQLLKNRKTYDIKEYFSNELAESIIDTLNIDQLPLDVISDLIESGFEDLVIPANQRFYLIQALKDYDLSNETLSVIASALEYLLVKTPVEGFVFQPNQNLPLWVEPGMNVRILKVNTYDFSFFNPLMENLKLSIEQVNDDTLSFTLHGFPFLTSYERQVVLGPTIYHQTTWNDNTNLDETTEGVIITETDDEIIYILNIENGVDGYVTYYKRLVIPLEGDMKIYDLYYEQTLPKNATKEQNRVEKE